MIIHNNSVRYCSVCWVYQVGIMSLCGTHTIQNIIKFEYVFACTEKCTGKNDYQIHVQHLNSILKYWDIREMVAY